MINSRSLPATPHSLTTTTIRYSNAIMKFFTILSLLSITALTVARPSPIPQDDLDLIGFLLGLIGLDAPSDPPPSSGPPPCAVISETPVWSKSCNGGPSCTVRQFPTIRCLPHAYFTAERETICQRRLDQLQLLPGLGRRQSYVCY